MKEITVNSLINTNRITVHHGILCAIFSLLFYSGAVLDQKIIDIFSFEFPAAAWFFIFIYPLSDAITEVYGPKKSFTTLITGYAVCCIFILLTVITIRLPYADVNNQNFAKMSYEHIEHAMLSCFGWGYLVFFIGMFINVKLLGKWKLRYEGNYYYLRSYIASSISEGFVVIFSNILIWSGRLPWNDIFIMIITTYIVKLIFTLGWALIGSIVKNILYAIEGENGIYKYNSSFHKKFNEIIINNKL